MQEAKCSRCFNNNVKTDERLVTWLSKRSLSFFFWSIDCPQIPTFNWKWEESMPPQLLQLSAPPLRIGNLIPGSRYLRMGGATIGAGGDISPPPFKGGGVRGGQENLYVPMKFSCSGLFHLPTSYTCNDIKHIISL